MIINLNNLFGCTERLPQCNRGCCGCVEGSGGGDFGRFWEMIPKTCQKHPTPDPSTQPQHPWLHENILSARPIALRIKKNSICVGFAPAKKNILSAYTYFLKC